MLEVCLAVRQSAMLVVRLSRKHTTRQRHPEHSGTAYFRVGGLNANDR
jgi:hypothetical protein